MPLACEPIDSVVGRPLRLRRRADLATAEVSYQGQPWRVALDPLTRQAVRLSPGEAAVLDAVSPEASLASVKFAAEARLAPRRVTHRELLQYLGRLHESGLVLADRPGQAYVLLARRSKLVRKRVLGQVTSLLSWRLPGIDPAPLLKVVHPLMGWLFTLPAVAAAVLLGLAAGLHLMIHHDELARRLPAFHEFFGAHNWLQLAITLAFVKVLHEFGHACCARRFGVHCRELGAMLLIGTPVLYCDVSEAWLLPSKWKRIAISSAGILVELVLASLATFVWWYSQPGLVHHLALTVMFVCSAGTVAFNGNPLLKFDGYHVLADIVEIPNLAQRSTDVWRRWLTVHGLGMELPDEIPLSARWRAFCALYGLAAAAYRVVVMISIFLFLRAVLTPYGAEGIAYLLTFMGATGMLVAPAWQIGRFLLGPGRLGEVKRGHAVRLGVLAAALILAVTALPLPDYAHGPVETRPAGAVTVAVTEPGRVERLLVTPGRAVAAGDVLAVLVSPELDLEVARLGARRDELDGAVRGLTHRRLTEAADGRDLATLVAERSGVDRQLSQLARRREALVLVAPVAGTVFALPAPPAGDRDPGETLPAASGTPFDAANAGQLLATGDAFCLVGDGALREAHVVLSQADAERVAPGQRAEVLVYGRGGAIVAGTVEQVAAAEAESLSPRLTTAHGGEVSATEGEDGTARPATPAFLATVPLPASAGPVGVGIRGRARVLTGYTPLATRVLRAALETFHFAR